MAVVQINDESFDQQLIDNERVVIKYYADWCGGCRLFSPKFKRLSNEDRYSNVTFLHINAEKNPHARRLAGVTNLPFFAIFKKGDLADSISTTKEDVVVGMLEKLL